MKLKLFAIAGLILLLLGFTTSCSMLDDILGGGDPTATAGPTGYYATPTPYYYPTPTPYYPTPTPYYPTPTPYVSTYYVYFYNGAADAQGYMNSQSASYGQYIYLNSNQYYRPGYTFSGWATYQGGTVTYYDGGGLTMYSNLYLYAVWTPVATPTPVTYRYIYFYSGADDATGYMSSQSVVNGQYVYLNTNQFSRPGYTFAGWATYQGGPVTYTTASTYAFYNDTYLYAAWTPAATPTPGYYIYYYNGAADATGYMPAQYFTSGQYTYLNTNQFSRPGYTFAGWATYYGAASASYYNGSGYYFYGETYLYAVWTPVATPTPYTTISFTTVGGYTNGYAQSGYHGSTYLPTKTIYFIGIQPSTSANFEVFNVDGTNPGVSGSPTTMQGFFKITGFGSLFSLSQFRVYNPGAMTNIRVDGWNSSSPFPPYASATFSYTTTVYPGWNTVYLTGCTGMYDVTIDFTDYTTLYFNDFAIQ